MQSQDLVIGRIPVLECLRAKKRAARRLFILQDAKGLDPILQAARTLPVQKMTRQELDKLTRGENHQGVLLEVNPLPILRLEDWLKRHAETDAVIVVLDGIEDPHNFGAIIRSAAACGAAAIIFGKNRSAPLSPAAAKAAAGAMEYIDLIQTPNLARGLKKLQDAGFWVAGLEADAPKLLWETDLKGRTALVIGSEGRGMRHIVRQGCDFVMRIPLEGPITSLNASASAAIALTECLRQRAT